MNGKKLKELLLLRGKKRKHECFQDLFSCSGYSGGNKSVQPMVTSGLQVEKGFTVTNHTYIFDIKLCQMPSNTSYMNRWDDRPIIN